MLGILLDVVALGAITTLLARQNMFDEWRDFVFFACGLSVIGFFLFHSGMPPEVALAAYCVLTFAGMRFVIGASWLGAAIGAALFIGYKFLVSSIL